MNTVCTSRQASLVWCEGKPVYPGIRRRIYYTSKNNIAEWPAIPVDEKGFPTSAILAGSFHLVADAVFHHIDVLVDKSGLTSDAQGEKPSQTQLNKLTAVYPGTDEEATLAASYINNTDNVYIVEDMAGKFRVIGNNRWQGKGTLAQDLGQGATGNAATTLTIEHTDIMPAPFYVGEIVTEEGTINPEGSGSGSGSGSAAE